jgi:hypothetical protein
MSRDQSGGGRSNVKNIQGGDGGVEKPRDATATPRDTRQDQQACKIAKDGDTLGSTKGVMVQPPRHGEVTLGSTKGVMVQAPLHGEYTSKEFKKGKTLVVTINSAEIKYAHEIRSTMTVTMVTQLVAINLAIAATPSNKDLLENEVDAVDKLGVARQELVAEPRTVPTIDGIETDELDPVSKDKLESQCKYLVAIQGRMCSVLDSTQLSDMMVGMMYDERLQRRLKIDKQVGVVLDTYTSTVIAMETDKLYRGWQHTAIIVNEIIKVVAMTKECLLIMFQEWNGKQLPNNTSSDFTEGLVNAFVIVVAKIIRILRLEDLAVGNDCNTLSIGGPMEYSINQEWLWMLRMLILEWIRTHTCMLSKTSQECTHLK